MNVRQKERAQEKRVVYAAASALVGKFAVVDVLHSGNPMKASEYTYSLVLVGVRKKNLRKELTVLNARQQIHPKVMARLVVAISDVKQGRRFLTFGVSDPILAHPQRRQLHANLVDLVEHSMRRLKKNGIRAEACSKVEWTFKVI